MHVAVAQLPSSATKKRETSEKSPSNSIRIIKHVSFTLDILSVKSIPAHEQQTHGKMAF